MYPLEGTLYSKRAEPWTNDKGESGERRYIIVESTRSFYNKRTHTTDTIADLPEFKLRNGLDFDDFEEGKPIKVVFSLRGAKRTWKDKTTGVKKTKHFTEPEAIFIEHMAIQSSLDLPPQNIKAKDIPNPEIFKEPNPLIDEPEDDLPF